MRRYGVIAILVGVAVGTHGVASAGSIVRASQAKAAPRVDGHLDDEAWEKGDWYTGFTQLSRSERPMAVQTRFKVAADATNLYIAVHADEPDMVHQIRTVTARDGKVWGDDCIEIMVGSDPAGSRYLHFIVNGRAALYDAEIFNEGAETNSSWDCDCEIGVARGIDTWSVEMRIPLVEVGVTETAAADWILNVARERRSGQISELSSFTPLSGGFHQPTRFAALRLPSLDLSQFAWLLQEPSEFEFVPDTEPMTCRAATRIENRTGSRRAYVLHTAWVVGEHRSEGEPISGALNPGQATDVAFGFPLAAQGQGTLVLELRDQQNPESLWATTKRQVDLTYVPIALDVMEPCYRNSIYATQRVDAVRAVVRLAVASSQREGAEVRATFERPEGDALVIVERTYPADKEVAVELPLPALATGDYILRAQLRRNGTFLEQASTPIRKLPSVAHEWRIDNHNVLLHNGEPFLPFGMFAIPADEAARPGNAYTVVQNYNAHWRSVEENLAFLDAFAAAGVYVTIYPYQGPGMLSPADVWGKPLTDEEAAGLRERVRALKDHPALFAWYMADEPELRPALPERTRQIYEIVASEDPYHPCIMLNDTIAGIYKYVDSGDVLMPDPYPCFLKDGDAAMPIEKVSKFIQACDVASEGRKPAWVTPQAFNYGDYGRENNRAPTFTELRNMTYQAAASGAKGFLYYIWSHTRNYVDLQVGMPFLAREAADLKPAILAPEVEGLVDVDAQIPEHLHWSARMVDGEVYVFAVNTATKPQKVRLAFPDADPPITKLNVVSENRAVLVCDKGTCADTFDAYDTHIYTTDANVAIRESIEAAMLDIERRTAALEKPGNLAFERTGVRVEVSSKSQFGSAPDRVLDGVENAMGWRDGTAGECPDWLDLVWPKAVKVGRVAVYSTTARELAVLVPEGEDWAELASVTEPERGVLTVSFPPVKTDRLRIEVRANADDARYTIISEVEAYKE
ncbi:MAG: hypothetical protein GY851_28260 [bacterium]|nr:hypothetical protein [bacterium]